MPSIAIKSSDEESEPILFPILSDQGFTLADLRTAFPLASSLRYRNEGESPYHHVLCRDDKFVEPDEGWFKDGRIYTAIVGTGPAKNSLLPVVAPENSRFSQFETFRKQLHQSSSVHFPGSSKSSKANVPITNIRVGNGHFKNGKFCKINAASRSGCGGVVNVGPYPTQENTVDAIKDDAFRKFCCLNRSFRDKYNNSKLFYLVYPDGSQINNLPDNSSEFSLLGYRNFLDPRMKYDRIRLYLCEKDNHDMNNGKVELLSDSSSSSEDLPELFSVTSNQNDSTLPLEKEIEPVLTVYFTVDNDVTHETFPNNSLAEVLYEFVEKQTKMKDFRITFGGNVIQQNVRLPTVFGDEVNVEVDVIHEKNSSVSDQGIRAAFDIEDNADTIVESVIREIGDVEEPTEILKNFMMKYLQGRALDVSVDTETIDGETSMIYVARNNVFNYGCHEILCIENLRFPLKVTFYGENGDDLGGLRREFFRLIIKEITEHLLENCTDGFKLRRTTDNIVDKKYYVAGIVVGLSAIQGGPCAPFLADIIRNYKESYEPDRQFRRGLQKTGIWQLIEKKPTVRFLFMPKRNATLTLHRLLDLLKPKFSDTGSNRRTNEERVYSVFVKYCREVAAGQRGPITLGNILQFVTGGDEEPVLGFIPIPCLEFVVTEGQGQAPTSSTCLNILKLPICNLSNEQYFQLFDFAFVNDYFGLQ